MPEDEISQLLQYMPKIAEVVNAFSSEAVQQQAFDALIAAWAGAEMPGQGLGRTEESVKSGEKGKEGSPTTRAERGARKRKAPSTSSSAVKDLDLRPAGKTSFDDFVAEKQPKSNEDKYAVVVYWLEQIVGLSPITAEHVGAVFRLTKAWKEPTSVRTGLSVVGVRKGTIDTSDMNSLATTPTGRNFVEHDLPAPVKK